MCEQCDDLTRKIFQFRRILMQNLDALTAERLATAVGEMETKKAALHPPRKYGRLS